MRKNYKSEELIVNLANQIPGANARLSTLEEDCEYQKADVVIGYNGRGIYLQVSNKPKSKGAKERLTQRDTYFIHTQDFEGNIEFEKVKTNLLRILAENDKKGSHLRRVA